MISKEEEAIWLKHYPVGVPQTISWDERLTLWDVFHESLQRFATRPALQCLGHSLTYQECFEQSEQLAGYFQQVLNLHQQTPIAIMLPNLLQYPIVLLAIIRTGCIAVNLNPLDKASSLEHELITSKAKVIIVLENFAHEIQKIVNKTSLETIITTEVGDFHAPIKGWMINKSIRYLKKGIPKWHINNSITLRQAMDLGKEQKLNPIEINPDDIMFIQFSSGTTAKAKAIPLKHKHIVANLMQVKHWIIPSLKQDREVIITALPLYHIFSLVANLLLMLNIGGENILIPNARDINSLIKVMKRYSFTCITGVNTLFQALLNHKHFSRCQFQRLTLSVGGGMAVNEKTADEWQKATGCVITQAYGMTECSPAISVNTMDSIVFNGSVGLPLPNTLVSIRNEKGKTLAANESGEIWVKGPQVMDEYYKNPEATKKALVKGWFKTGDIGTLNEQGTLYIIDRLKDMVIVSGFNVAPNEVEQCLVAISEINEIAIIGIPNREQGESLFAFVVLNKGSRISAKKIIKYAYNHLAPYKVPHYYHFVKEIPKNTVGKVLKPQLRLSARSLKIKPTKKPPIF
jgi:long-chain acyl-CoA synthetase